MKRRCKCGNLEPYIDDYSLEEVLLPFGSKEAKKAIMITVRGRNFPMRAIPPTLSVGDVVASYLAISDDECSMTGYLLESPKEGDEISVSYESSIKRTAKEPFTFSKLKKLRGD